MKPTMKKGIVKKCLACGKNFVIWIDPDTKRILSGGYYFGKINFPYFEGWLYKIENLNSFNDLLISKPVFKNIWYKILYRSYIGRIYPKIWRLFNPKKIEYFECDDCFKEALREEERQSGKYEKEVS